MGRFLGVVVGRGSVFFAQMPVETLGRAMVKEAESKLGAEPSEEPMVFSNKVIKKIAEHHSAGP